MTEYFYQVIQSTKHPVISFKDNDFVTFSFDEIKQTNFVVNPNDEICCLLSEKEYMVLFKELSLAEKKNIKFPIICKISCAISYKTLKTKFNYGVKKNDELEEMTGVFYIRADLLFSRHEDDTVSAVFSFDIKNLPWFSRAFINPTYNEKISVVTSEDKIDAYLETTTEKRVEIDSWKEYINYCDDFFNSTADLSLGYEANCYLFNKSFIDCTTHIETLYSDLRENTKLHLLYDRFTQTKLMPILPLIPNENINAMCKHNGQMNGKYPLADSQRQAVHHLKSIKDGELLAVSGPPGTGKTTLLQSIVADLVVDSALNQTEPPVIVATSSNNQAVTNIIDSFSNIEKIGLSNLEERWINGVKSFATYMPSDGKREDAEQKGYQFTSIHDSEFILDAENNIKFSEQKIKVCAKMYFGKEFSTIGEIKTHLQTRLKSINDLKHSLLITCEEINQFTKGEELVDYIAQIEAKIEKIKRLNEYNKERIIQWNENYKAINFWLRLFSFIPIVKRKISNKFMIFATPQESEFINSYATFSDIEAFYARKIFETNSEINHLSGLKMQAEKHLINFKNVVKQLHKNNCDIPLLNEEGSVKTSTIYKVNECIDSSVRYIQFWLAVHINECRFLQDEYKLTERQRGKNYENVLSRFYHQIALLSPCFVMTLYMLPKNFKTFVDGNNSYMYDFIDLLVIDEAGQCSPEIASASFSLCKRAIIVGDESQIPPVVNTDVTVDYSIAKSSSAIGNSDDFYNLIDCGLSCSQGNVMRVAKKSCAYQSNEYDRGLFLCEHRRCYDEIINYSNELIYNGMLVPKRNELEKLFNKKRVLDEIKYPFMAYFDITTEKSATNGTSRYNEVEAHGIAVWLKNHYKELLSFYTSDNKCSKENILAIITPFKSQVAVLKRYLKNELGDDSNDISVGTVHTFQGTERNIIIFSTVYGGNENCSFIDNIKNLMNVAVSRAKDAFWVFGSIDCIKNKSEYTASGLMYRYISNNNISE